MEIAGRKALVIGAARSGIASARFLAQRGSTVALNDRKPLSDWPQTALDLKTEGIGLVEGDPPSWLLDQIDLLGVSPGVPTNAIPIRYAARRGVEVIGEIELASRFLRVRIVAITGTNGETTPTTVIGQMFQDRRVDERGPTGASFAARGRSPSARSAHGREGAGCRRSRFGRRSSP